MCIGVGMMFETCWKRWCGSNRSTATFKEIEKVQNSRLGRRSSRRLCLLAIRIGTGRMHQTMPQPGNKKSLPVSERNPDAEGNIRPDMFYKKSRLAKKNRSWLFFFTFHRRLDFSVWKEAVDRLRIRLHTAHIGHPTVCDAKYCSATTFKEREGRAMEIRRVTRSN